MTISRLAIVERGEMAMRVLHAARELAEERGRPITVIAVHPESDRHAQLARDADDAVALPDGEPPDLALSRALSDCRADAVWAGDPQAMAEPCRRAGIALIGPQPALIQLLGDRSAIRRLADRVGIPIEPAGPAARRLEVDVVADGDGGAWALGVRDCSCRHEGAPVLIEAIPSADPIAPELIDAAQSLIVTAGYRGAATVVFRAEGSGGRWWLHGTDIRLGDQSVTEALTGVDLVKLQLHLAAGGALPAERASARGHAFSVRLRAWDPDPAPAPAPARLVVLRLPSGPGIRVDAAFDEGAVVLAGEVAIATLTVWGRDRDEALARLRRAVAASTVVVDGRTTNQGVLLELLARPELRAGAIGPGSLDGTLADGDPEGTVRAQVALIQAAIELADRDLASDRARFYAYARRGRAESAAERGRTYELGHDGAAYRIGVAQIAPERYRITVGDEVTLEACAHRLGDYERRLELQDRSRRTLTSELAGDLLVQVDGFPHRISRDDAGVVRNPSPAVVVSIPVAEGDLVEAGEVVAVVEAMKMESSLTAPFRGRVRRVLSGENVHLPAGAPLLVIEAVGGTDAPAGAPRLAFAPDAPPESLGDRCHRHLRRMEWLVLGYDVQDGTVQRTVSDLREANAASLFGESHLVAAEHRLLAMYADLRALSSPQLREDRPSGEPVESPREALLSWVRSLDAAAEGLSEGFTAELRRALHHYGIDSLERTPELERAGYRLFLSQQRSDGARAVILAILESRLEQAGQLAGRVGEDFRDALDRLVIVLGGRDPVLADLAREVRYRYFEQPVITAARERTYADMAQKIAALATNLPRAERESAIDSIVDCPRPLATLLTTSTAAAAPRVRPLLVEAMTRRYYRVRSLTGFEPLELGATSMIAARYEFDGRLRHLIAGYVELAAVADTARAFAEYAESVPDGELAVLDLYAEHPGQAVSGDALAAQLHAALAGIVAPPALHRVVVAVAQPRRGRGMSAVGLHTFRPDADGVLAEDVVLRGLHPMMAHRLKLWRFSEFELTRLPSSEDLYVFEGRAHEHPDDERLFALAEVRDLTPVIGDDGRVVALPELERVTVSVLETIRAFQAPRPLHRRVMWNRALLYAWPVLELPADQLRDLMAPLAPLGEGLGLEMMAIQGRMREADGTVRERLLRFFAPTGTDVRLEIDDPPSRPLQPRGEGTRRMVSARRRGMLHPAEIVRLIAPPQAAAGQPAGEFVEHDLDESGRLVPVERPVAMNTSGIVVGTIRNFTERYPEGMLRVILLGDPTRALGALAEPECRRILAALELAHALGVPVDWFALSAGAKIAMDSGTETMDWIARVLRGMTHHTQAGGEVNVVVVGINVGAQPYFNAEATMLMHTRGTLTMTPESAMVLTGKQSLDYSGGVSAEDNFGIGGYERIMGPNGQAQYWAPDLPSACRLLLAYYEHSYVAPGERFPRRARTSDPAARDICAEPHEAPGSPFTRVGEVFSPTLNPDRKQPFDMRSLMRAVVDHDHAPLERWGRMYGGDVAIVWDAHIGGWPVAMIGIESRPLPRHGAVPADGPEQWTSGTLFPRAAKKIARAINSAAGRRPLVVMANLAGFDGSPESMRAWQLEFGAEIGRAVVNYDGPIVFCVVSRYHGGSFVVFSQKLNPNMETVALEGARASVIGGGPAAAVVFVREVERKTASDSRIVELDARIVAAGGPERQRLRAERAMLWSSILAHNRREFADRFDATHSVERAVRMGSVNAIVAPAALRRYLIDAVQRGVDRVLAAEDAADTSANGAAGAVTASATPPLPASPPGS